ncbi:MAG: VOC family protein [Pseudomonadota bacterium]
MSDTHGHFNWNELISHDVAAAREFYATTIGWTFKPMEMGPDMTYWIAHDGDQPVCGMMDFTKDMPKDLPTHWMAYLAVDDVDARLEKAKAAGAEVLSPPFDVPGVGRIAMLRDPTGGAIGWITPAPREG